MHLRPLMLLLLNFGAFSLTTRISLSLLDHKGSLVFLSSPRAKQISSTGAQEIYIITISTKVWFLLPPENQFLAT